MGLEYQEFNTVLAIAGICKETDNKEVRDKALELLIREKHRIYEFDKAVMTAKKLLGIKEKVIFVSSSRQE